MLDSDFLHYSQNAFLKPLVCIFCLLPLQVYDPSLLSAESKPACVLEKHTGSVAALDANPFQSNLLASGSSDSEIYIWDLAKPDNPMTPGAKS